MFCLFQGEPREKDEVGRMAHAAKGTILLAPMEERAGERETGKVENRGEKERRTETEIARAEIRL